MIVSGKHFFNRQMKDDSSRADTKLCQLTKVTTIFLYCLCTNSGRKMGFFLFRKLRLHKSLKLLLDFLNDGTRSKPMQFRESLP